MRAVNNAKDGISFIHTGDGAINEMTQILHRMKEITVKSLNDTNVDADRATLQTEFDQWQFEINRISKETEFNTLKIFEQHEASYNSIQGNRE